MTPTKKTTASGTKRRACPAKADLRPVLVAPIDAEASPYPFGERRFDYIELFYNRMRPHQTLDYRTPIEVEVQYEQMLN